MRFGEHCHMICIFDLHYFFWLKVPDHPTLVILKYYITLSRYYIYTCNGSVSFFTEASCPSQIVCNEGVCPHQHFRQFKILVRHDNNQQEGWIKRRVLFIKLGVLLYVERVDTLSWPWTLVPKEQNLEDNQVSRTSPTRCPTIPLVECFLRTASFSQI